MHYINIHFIKIMANGQETLLCIDIIFSIYALIYAAIAFPTLIFSRYWLERDLLEQRIY